MVFAFPSVSLTLTLPPHSAYYCYTLPCRNAPPHRPGQAHSAVICTGEFDNWQGTQLLSKNADGTWSADVKVPYDPAGEREIKYKVGGLDAHMRGLASI